jgi:glucosamine-6-phosphate deaminase
MLKLNLLEETRYEKVPVKVFKNGTEASAAVDETSVLGLATGVIPIKIYKELIRLHKEEGLSFKNVVTFNLDEYYPIQPDAEQSYVRFMKENLFDQYRYRRSGECEYTDGNILILAAVGSFNLKQ